MNACGHHHVGHIGVLGVDKNNDEFYQVTLGGRQGNDRQAWQSHRPLVLGRRNARRGRQDHQGLCRKPSSDERFLDTFDRIGIDPFKNRVYEGRAHGKAKLAQKEAA
jgi:sulfite reductase (NADPH) hemoprotein beta-component